MPQLLLCDKDYSLFEYYSLLVNSLVHYNIAFKSKKKYLYCSK